MEIVGKTTQYHNYSLKIRAIKLSILFIFFLHSAHISFKLKLTINVLETLLMESRISLKIMRRSKEFNDILFNDNFFILFQCLVEAW